MIKTLLISTLILLGSSVCAHSQFFASFDASEGEEAAENYVIGDLGFSQPILIAVATVDEDFSAEFGGIPVNIDAGMNIENGESEAWVYIYNENGSDQIATVGVVNVFGSYQATDVSEELGNQIPELEYIELTNSWKDSPEICELIREDIDYQGYKLSNPNSKPYFSGISVTDETTGGTEMRSVWVVTFGENEDYICFVDANSGSTNCDILSSVEVNNNQDEIVFYPNPATDKLEFTNSIDSQIKSISIVNINGENVINYLPVESATIDVSNLSVGTYIVVVETNVDRIVKKIIIK
ncbi:MAG: T9SS type A sorting domain-containing protein [Chlorobiota bacterium]